MYQSITMMIRDHFPRCADVPPEVRELYGRLRRLGTRRRSSSGTGGGSKLGGNAARYTRGFWVESAGRCGLSDDPGGDGIRYRRPADGQGIQLPTGGAAAGGVGPGVVTGVGASVEAATAPAERGTVADSQGNAAASSSRKPSRKKRKKRKAGEVETSVETVAV